LKKTMADNASFRAQTLNTHKLVKKTCDFPWKRHNEVETKREAHFLLLAV